MSYKIVRYYQDRFPGRDGHLQTSRRTIHTGLTLEEAQEHCELDSTRGQDHRGRWFDGYTEE